MGFVKENWQTISLGILVVTVTWSVRGWTSSIDGRIENLEKAVKEIKDFLKSIFPSTTLTNSPINLTDLGKDVSQELNASSWARSVALSLVNEEVPELKAFSHYEIQKYCFDIVEERAGLTEMGKQVEKSAYKKGLKKQQVLDVLAIELRDSIFERLNMDKNANY